MGSVTASFVRGVWFWERVFPWSVKCEAWPKKEKKSSWWKIKVSLIFVKGVTKEMEKWSIDQKIHLDLKKGDGDHKKETPRSKSVTNHKKYHRYIKMCLFTLIFLKSHRDHKNWILIKKCSDQKAKPHYNHSTPFIQTIDGRIWFLSHFKKSLKPFIKLDTIATRTHSQIFLFSTPKLPHPHHTITTT